MWQREKIQALLRQGKEIDMSGMMNRILVLDLTLEKIEEKSLQPEILKVFIGGSSLAAQLFLDCNGHEFEPLAAQSPLIVMAGPLVGTNFPGSSRFCMCARSPLTGIWGESASGGAFGAELKKAGFDGILITGQSQNPICIVIEDSKAIIEDAGELWGQDTYDTIDALKEKHAGKKPGQPEKTGWRLLPSAMIKRTILGVPAWVRSWGAKISKPWR